jgi:hypothetical protein
VLHGGRGVQGRVQGGQGLALQRVHADRGFQQVAVKGRGRRHVQGGLGGRRAGFDLGQQVGELGVRNGQADEV